MTNLDDTESLSSPYLLRAKIVPMSLPTTLVVVVVVVVDLLAVTSAGMAATSVSNKIISRPTANADVASILPLPFLLLAMTIILPSCWLLIGGGNDEI